MSGATSTAARLEVLRHHVVATTDPATGEHRGGMCSVAAKLVAAAGTGASNTSASAVRLVVDTDAGVDDAQAILTALRAPGVTIEAITTVAGNCDVDQVRVWLVRVGADDLIMSARPAPRLVLHTPL